LTFRRASFEELLGDDPAGVEEAPERRFRTPLEHRDGVALFMPPSAHEPGPTAVRRPR
jgi:hypothetical protein